MLMGSLEAASRRPVPQAAEAPSKARERVSKPVLFRNTRNTRELWYMPVVKINTRNQF
jgi:hypothetical protein